MHDAGEEPEPIAELRARAANALERGEPLAAYDAASRALSLAPDDPEIRQLLARALARSGAASRALAVAGQLYASGLRDEETIGIVARTHKDQWLRNRSAPDAAAHLRRALTFYSEGHTRHRSSWMGINRATLLVMDGQTEEAAVVARGLARQCQEELAASAERREDYWASATLAEASLVLGDIHNAIRWYSHTRKLALEGAQRLGDFGSTVRNARLLLELQGDVPAALEAALTLPPVIVFAGHMIDRPGRPVPRFPEGDEHRVAEAIRTHLARLDPVLGYASAACGADILFLEEMLARGADIHVVLPFERDPFVRTSVDATSTGEWRNRFDRVLARAAAVTVASEGAGTSGYAFEYGALVCFGLALNRASQMGARVHGLAVWDRCAGDGPGGTEGSVRAWRTRDIQVDIVVPFASPAPAELRFARPTHAPSAGGELGAVLFADAVGYGRLTEEQIPLFVEHFLAPVAALAAQCSRPPLTANTWGDGLFFVFDEVETAGGLALAMCRLAEETNWGAKGLPSELNVRVGLHAGPIRRYQDPVTGRLNFFGAHVSRGARIEPITPPGHVYASEAFAALSAAAGATGYACEYVGRTAMAKGAGRFAAYHVRDLRS